MAAHKHIDRICAAAMALALLITLLFMNGEALGLQSAARAMGYETRLFDTSRVHTIDIVMDDWDSFLETCENEEYSACAVVIDGEAYKNIGLRAKGNTSLSTVSQLGSSRYSFKLEFDCYESGKSYYGLDKLCLNNLIQDNTCMKDYLTYRLMAAFGVNAPLCSYVWITVNGEDWGLYLAVEGIEDAFLRRNYGQNSGELYKPDSSNMGGGRGNGQDFNMDDFEPGFGGADAQADFGGGAPTDAGAMSGGGGTMADGGAMGGGFGGSMGSSDVKLQYIDDDPDSYANIFGNAKTDITDTDKARLIQSLKALSEGGDVSDVVDIDQVLRYFVVHNFVVNGDSYTGSIIHNYYLYEKDGQLAMLPWDYNLAFGSFQNQDASSAVNDPIDTPLSVTGDGSLPMADWIFSDEAYTELYHQYFAEFLSTVDPAVIIEEARGLIASYVERDPTAFCTAEEFETGVDALTTFCALRAQSVSGQLAGEIPSTGAGQSADSSALVDASAVSLSDMGTMNAGGFGGGHGGDTVPAFRGRQMGDDESFPEGENQPGGMAIPDGEDSPPDNMMPPDGSSTQTEGMEPNGSDSSPFSGRGPMGGGGAIPANGGLSEPFSETPDAGGPILLGASVLVLLAGLLAAFKFKR